MLKVILNDILINLNKNWLQILLNFMLFTYLSINVLAFVYYQNTHLPITPDFLSNLALSDNILKQSMLIISGISLLFLFTITKNTIKT